MVKSYRVPIRRSSAEGGPGIGLGMSRSIVDQVRETVDAALPRDRELLLAVSGGVDSMVMLDAALAVRSSLRIATFDHASGDHSARARELVERAALAASVPLDVARFEGEGASQSEAAWREARLRFLRAVASERRALTCTAHTRDDQVETVLFRELRGTGARGLAGLLAKGETIRPLLSVRRAEIMDYARDSGVEWVEDPTNLDRSYARNRIRHDILPALRRCRPTIDDDLAAAGEAAARWRAHVEQVVDRDIPFESDRERSELSVGVAALRGRSDDELGIIWQTLLGRIGIAMDWRGTRRLIAFTSTGTTGRQIQLSGGWRVHRMRRSFEVRGAHRLPERRPLPGLPFLSEYD
jgi:tRNA(Ile)-lysidine synthase